MTVPAGPDVISRYTINNPFPESGIRSMMIQEQDNLILVSIVIPCYCSEHYLAQTVDGICQAFRRHPGFTYQLILVNDGSPDQTFSVIRDLCARDPYITGIDLERNYGQGAAKTAGIRYICGSYAVFMDDDGQHDPDAIWDLLRKIDKQYDLVYAQFPHMQESLWRRAAGRIHDIILKFLTGKPRGLTITSYFALSSHAAEYLKSQDFYAASVGLTLFPVTKKVTGIPVEHQMRTEGSSHYTMRKLFSEWFRMLKGSKRTIPADLCRVHTILNEPGQEDRKPAPSHRDPDSTL